MSENKTILILLFLILIVYIVMAIPVELAEGFTSDEAIQNVASLYNTGNMTVSNLNSTSSITTPKVSVSGTITAGTLTAGSVIDNSMNGTIKAYIDSKINALQTQGNAQFAAINKQINTIVIWSPQWKVSEFVELIANGKYFNSSHPEGYALRFMFVHPNNDTSTTHFDYWHGVASKFGRQFLLYEINVPQHTNVPNTSTNQANWEWRGNY